MTTKFQKSTSTVLAPLWVAVYLVVALLSNVGCQCLGPTSTCLRNEGPILSLTRRIKEQHLQRSQYTRTVPDPYVEQLPPQTNTSRFHPVPTRDVFSPPMQMGHQLPLLSGPGQYLDDYGPNQVYENPDATILGPAPGETFPGAVVPPIYQPSAPSSELNLNTSPMEPETLPAPMESERNSETEGPVPSELERPENTNDKVTHRDLIQYPYTLDIDRPYSDWVRGIEPTRSANENQRAAKQQLRSNAAWRSHAQPMPVVKSAPSTGQVSFQSPEFAPPVFGKAYVDGRQTNEPRPGRTQTKLLQRVTSFGPMPTPPIVRPTTPVKNPAVKRNGVPYTPSNDPNHPMFKSHLPFVQLQQNNGRRTEEVQLHSALQDRFMGTTIR